MKYSGLILIVFLGTMIGACKKGNYTGNHVIRYSASSDTFNLAASYTDTNGLQSDTIIVNGWKKSISTDKHGFKAQLILNSDSGKHLVGNIYVDEQLVADSVSNNGHLSVTYILP
ncbi:MAG: hypothetical protein H0X33_13575 [Taibaiella sp.]|nr:hypothetical protein [Taibaiella sp.]